MTEFSARLQHLRETTADCLAHARERAAKDALLYRGQAERFKALAISTRLPGVQASRLRIAASYERLAELAEGTPGVAELGGHAAGGSEQPTRQARAAQTTPEHARQAILWNDDRRIATAALLALSRALCEFTAAVSREAREKLKDRPTADRFF